jgi:hypothetical protein
VLVGAHNGAVDDGVLVIGLPSQVLEYFGPHPARRPAAEPGVDGLPGAKALGQVAPGNPGPVAVENRLHKQPVILRGHADMAFPSR